MNWKSLLQHFIKDKKLGIAEDKHRYDLPLNKDAGALFLIILIALMSFLASMALTGYLALGKTTDQWVAGLENSLTVEIPAENPEGKLLSKMQIQALSSQAYEEIIKINGVKDAIILKEGEIQKLVEPWLGSDILLADIPLPILITVKLEDSEPETFKELEHRMKNVSPVITVDTHEGWLTQILRLAMSMRLSSAFVTLAIGLTTIVAIAGSIRSRMAMHESDVELLHLMGASDLYITKQFQRHAFVLALKGSMIGVMISFTVLGLFYILQPEGGVLMPALHQNGWNLLSIALLPFAICGLAILAAKHTILRALAQMP